MKVKVSDYIANFLVDHGISTVFTVIGGGAMHMNDSFGHNPNLHCVYQHHEQACSIAAEGYARIHNQMAAVCVTSGPGALNAINGVVGAFMDSIPMLVFSGQTKTTLTMRCNDVHLRSLGNQEVDIVSAMKSLTKWCDMIVDPEQIRYYLEKAYYTALSGRPGPVWLDVPLDIQAKFVESDNLQGFVSDDDKKELEVISDEVAESILYKMRTAKRPVIYAGNGIRLAGAENDLAQFAQNFDIPVVTCWNSIDLIPTESDYYAGRGGIMGDRGGNFAVQNSDLLISIGSRLHVYQTGYEIDTWAREAYKIMVDIDKDELTKPTLHTDLSICMDAGDFMRSLLKRAAGKEKDIHREWILQCQEWKKRYPVVTSKHYESETLVNVYALLDQLSRAAGAESVTVAANGSASVVGSQTYYIAPGQRFIMNCALSSMGYGLPAAIGAAVANQGKDVICVEGDGSIQMNIQELATVVANKLPIKIFVINNGGYHQCRQTQKNVFRNNTLIGIGPESGDLIFPDFGYIAQAYGIVYYKIENMLNLRENIEKVLGYSGCCLCEVLCDTIQGFEPKSATKQLENGRLYSPPLEDLAPFLPREELRENMYIDLVEEK